MSDPVSCEGAPRDLGRAQGVASRAVVRSEARADTSLRHWLDRLGLGDAATSRWRRDLRRYFPHQHEWQEGVARAAGVPDRALLRAAIAALEQERRAVLVGRETGAGPLLLRTPAAGSELRRVRPEGRFASIELASPLLATPWIGVNEAGLGVAVSGGHQPGPCRAHAALLARDCLERFESVESALAWCTGRPAAPGAAILLADATGELAGIELTPTGRLLRRPENGELVLGDAGVTLAEHTAATVDVSKRELRATPDGTPLVP